ncbi:MAG: hypothetical protein V4492_02365 [Chlamydiota bacterium]
MEARLLARELAGDTLCQIPDRCTRSATPVFCTITSNRSYHQITGVADI